MNWANVYDKYSFLSKLHLQIIFDQYLHTFYIKHIQKTVVTICIRLHYMIMWQCPLHHEKHNNVDVNRELLADFFGGAF